MKVKPAPVVAVVMVLATLAACAASGRSETTGRGQGQPAAVRYRGALAAEEDSAALGVLLSPPGGAVPKLGWQEAYSHCAGQGCITDGQSTDVVLARATTTASGSAGIGGTLIPGTVEALTYALIARNAECPMPAGGVTRPGDPAPAAVSSHDCTFIQLIDADTGQLGYAASGRSAS